VPCCRHASNRKESFQKINTTADCRDDTAKELTWQTIAPPPRQQFSQLAKHLRLHIFTKTWCILHSICTIHRDDIDRHSTRAANF
jgi:hypothetical protein